MDSVALLALVAGTGLVEYLERYRLTTHGDNPWSVDGLLNVVRLAHHFESARAAINGTYSSVFRSERVNNLVGGVTQSDHLGGRATDILTSIPLDDAASKILMLARAGKLGPVRQVIREPGWIHVGWHKPGASGAPEFIVKKA